MDEKQMMELFSHLEPKILQAVETIAERFRNIDKEIEKLEGKVSKQANYIASLEKEIHQLKSELAIFTNHHSEIVKQDMCDEISLVHKLEREFEKQSKKMAKMEDEIRFLGSMCDFCPSKLIKTDFDDGK